MYLRSITLCFALAATSLLAAQDEHPGLAIGKRAPNFTLKDQNNEPVQLVELLKKNGSVAVVFHRSADW